MRPGQEGAFAGFSSTVQAYHATSQGTSVPGLNVLQGNVADLTALGTVLAGQSSVTYVEPNGQVQIAGVTPNDPYYTNTSQANLNGTYGINAPGAWSVETGSPSVIVAVIDTGINYNHPDLYQNIWINQAEIPDQWYSKSNDGTYDKVVHKSDIQTATPGVITFGDLNNPLNAGLVYDNNADGVIDAGDLLRPVVQGGWDSGSTKDGDTAHPDDYFGWNFLTGTNNPMDDNGHGSNVAGIIGATGNNGIGITGVDWQAQLMAVKVFNANGGGGTDAQIAAAIDYAAAHRARLSNNSWGGPGYSSTIQQAINTAAAATYGQGQGTGMVFAAAAGNLGYNNDTNPFYPASYTGSNIISVANMQNGALNSTSDYGPTTVDVAAPGTLIWGAAGSGNGYTQYTGTSQATPEAAGVAALLLQENPGWSATQVVNQIENTVTPYASLTGKIIYPGIINAGAALEDLNWSGGSLTGPSTVNSGTPFTVTRSYNVVGGPVLPDFTISYYAGTSPTFNINDQLLATETINTTAGKSTGLQTGTSPNLQISPTGTYYIFAVLDSGNTVFETNDTNNTASTAVTVTSPAGQGTQVNLGASFNDAGIVTDGSTFANTAGLDGGGHSLSSNLLGSSVSWDGLTFALGAANANDALANHAQTINLPAGNYSKLDFLATTVWANYTNVQYTVTYTDNSTQTFTQSFSAWDTPQNYAGESKAATMSYRDSYNGTKDNTTVNVYGYTIALNGTKQIKSITLPELGRINILAVTLA